jgi:hypothetical protein
MQQLPIQVQQVQRPAPKQQQPKQVEQQQQQQQQQFRVVSSKLSNIQLVLIASVLFFIFANPKLFSTVNKILPGVIQDYAGKVTQQGTITHAVVFGVVFFGAIYLLQRPTVEAYGQKKYLGMTPQ